MADDAFDTNANLPVGVHAHPSDSKEAQYTPLSLHGPLAALADAAVDHAHGCLSSLELRSDPVEYDRGARTAESLMRVARSAAILRAQLQKEAIAHEKSLATTGEEQSNDGTWADPDELDQEARRLAERFVLELDRIETRQRAVENCDESGKAADVVQRQESGEIGKKLNKNNARNPKKAVDPVSTGGAQ